MCGRYKILPQADWSEIYGYLGNSSAKQFDASPARYNIAPSEAVPIVIHDNTASPKLIDARWGLVPHWWSQNQLPTKTSNARSETASKKPMWREAWRTHRCLIPATGWYEWFNYETGTREPLKIPHHIQPSDERPFMFGGLWSEWHRHGRDDIMVSATIVTYASPPDIAVIHERTPLVLKPQYWDQWLKTDMQNSDQVQRMVQEGAIHTFTLRPIDTAVSKAINRGPECLETKTWAELEAQGTVRYNEVQLAELRERDHDGLVSQLIGKSNSIPAERRLWIRELMDRDDAAMFEGFLNEVRYTLRPSDSSQANLI